MQFTFTRKQVLNITTGYLHTTMDEVYEFFTVLIEPGMFTHMLPNAMDAIRPILIGKIPDIEQEGHHPDAEGNVSFDFDENDKRKFIESFSALPSLLAGKNVQTIIV